MQDKLAAVFGGSGFLGRYVVGALAGIGWRVRAASRRPYLAGHLQPMGDVGQIHAVQANVRHAYSVSGPVEGAETVVNLVGISRKSGAQTFEDVHVGGACAVARAARKAGAKTLIHVSTICAHPNSTSHLGRTQGRRRGGRARRISRCRHSSTVPYVWAPRMSSLTASQPWRASRH